MEEKKIRYKNEKNVIAKEMKEKENSLKKR